MIPLFVLILFFSASASAQFPTGQPRPNASMLNAFEGQTVTNSTIVPAGTAGAIDLFAYRRTHAVVEISGYFSR